MAALVDVFGQFLTADLVPVESGGSVRFSPVVTAVNDDPLALVTTGPAVAEVLGNGRMSISLIASDDLDAWRSDEPVPYSIEVRVPGFRETFVAMIPAPGPHDLADLIRLTT